MGCTLQILVLNDFYTFDQKKQLFFIQDMFLTTLYNTFQDFKSKTC